MTAAAPSPNPPRAVPWRALVVAAAAVLGGGRLARDELALTRAGADVAALRSDSLAWRRRHQELDARLAAAHDAAARAEADQARVATELAVEVARGHQAAQELAAAAQALEAAAAQRDADREHLARARAQQVRLEQAVAAARDALSASEARADALGSDLAGLRADLAAVAREAAAAREDLDRIEQAGVNVARLTGARPMPAIDALVVEVDLRALPPRVVLNAGAGQGLEPGDRLVLVQDGRELTELVVDDVGPRLAACRVVRGRPDAPPRLGDRARSLTP